MRRVSAEWLLEKGHSVKGGRVKGHGTGAREENGGII